MSLFYKLWADAIIFERAKFGSTRNWKFFIFLLMSIYQGLNLFTIFVFLIILGIKIDIFIDFNLFPSEELNSALSGFSTMLLPFLLLNYLLIFKGKRYRIFVHKYSSRKGKLYLCYVFITAVMLFMSLFLAILDVGLAPF